jgi:hypothetical protein
VDHGGREDRVAVADDEEHRHRPPRQRIRRVRGGAQVERHQPGRRVVQALELLVQERVRGVAQQQGLVDPP